MLAHLRITRADGRVEDISLPLGTYQIGRDVGHIVLNDPQASGSHARLEVHPHGVLLTDIGSSNGTFDSRGRRLTEPAPMPLDQAFRLGNSSIVLTRAIAPSGGTIVATSAMSPSAQHPVLPPVPPVGSASVPAAIPAAIPTPRPFGPATQAAPPTPASAAGPSHDPGSVAPAVAEPGPAHGDAGPAAGSPGRPARGPILEPGLLGGLVGGVLSSVPLLGSLNLACCLLNVIGCQIGLFIYFNRNPSAKLRGRDAAELGFISGTTAGVLTALVHLVLMGPMLMLMGRMTSAIGSGMSLAMMLVGVVLFGGVGALGGFLGLQVFFSSHKAR